MKEDMIKSGAQGTGDSGQANPEVVRQRGLKPDADADKVKLVNDGNLTRQIYEGIGFETLQTEKSAKKEKSDQKG